jgi:hypothetical protein
MLEVLQKGFHGLGGSFLTYTVSRSKGFQKNERTAVSSVVRDQERKSAGGFDSPGARFVPTFS